MIPESQLATWANVGAVKAATDTYTSIKTALDAGSSLKALRYEVYLQGSYRNSTNIYGDMDVDIVVESRQSFYYNIDALTELQRAEFKRQFPGSSEHTFSRFRAAVEEALKKYYSSSQVTLSNKCIKVAKKPGRLDADVVPCVQYCEYRRSTSPALPTPYEGIVFFTRDTNRRVANSLVGEHAAPSYIVTCLVYNAPSEVFKKGYADSVLAILQWMRRLTDDDFRKLVCQNGLVWLVRDTPDQWRLADAKGFRNAAIQAW